MGNVLNTLINTLSFISAILLVIGFITFIVILATNSQDAVIKWFNNIINPSPYEYIGCFKDDEVGAGYDRALKNNLGNLSLGECYAQAKDQGYKLFGMQATGQCWAGSDLNNAQKFGKINDTECYYECNQNLDNPVSTDGPQCGLGWVNALYKIK